MPAERPAEPIGHDLARRDFRLMENWDDAEASAIIAPTMHNAEATAEPPAAHQPGVAGARATYDWLHSAYADLHWTIHRLVAEGEWVVARTTMSGRQIALQLGWFGPPPSTSEPKPLLRAGAAERRSCREGACSPPDALTETAVALAGRSGRPTRLEGVGRRAIAKGISRLGPTLVVGYLALVAVLEVLRRTTSWPRPDDLASSPAGVAAGNVWALLTSGLVVAGDPVVQIAGTTLTAFVVIQVAGSSIFWAAVLVAHVGSALLAYAGVAVLWLFARADVDAVVDAPDYGISCVWAGAAGALAAATLARRSRRERLLAPLAVGVFFVAIPPSLGLAGAEHALAFALGALTVAALARRDAAPSPPLAAT